MIQIRITAGTGYIVSMWNVGNSVTIKEINDFLTETAKRDGHSVSYYNVIVVEIDG